MNNLSLLLLGTFLVPAVALSQVGPPTFNVNVANTPLPVQGAVTASDNPAFQPFQHSGSISVNVGTLGGDATFTVPAGKRLVIEFVSFRVTYPTGQKPTFNFVSVVNANSNQIPISHDFPLVYQATGLFTGQMSDVYIGSSPTRLYGDPGSTVTLGVRREGTTGSGLASVKVSGHLVNLP